MTIGSRCRGVEMDVSDKNEYRDDKDATIPIVAKPEPPFHIRHHLLLIGLAPVFLLGVIPVLCRWLSDGVIAYYR